MASVLGVPGGISGLEALPLPGVEGIPQSICPRARVVDQFLTRHQEMRNLVEKVRFMSSRIYNLPNNRIKADAQEECRRLLDTFFPHMQEADGLIMIIDNRSYFSDQEIAKMMRSCSTESNQTLAARIAVIQQTLSRNNRNPA